MPEIVLLLIKCTEFYLYMIRRGHVKVVPSEEIITRHFGKRQNLNVMLFTPCLVRRLHAPERATESKSKLGQEFLKFIRLLVLHQ